MLAKNEIKRDATEFGVGVRCGGWRLGLLVARCVAHGGTGGRPGKNRSLENSSGKVSMNQFAELADVSTSHVKYYFDAWELAAKAGLVPTAITIDVGDNEIDVEVDDIEDEDNPRTHWSHFYQLAKNPPEEKKPKEEENSDSEVDEDFGLTENEDESPEVVQADSDIMRNRLLEILESTQALTSRLTTIGSVDPSLIELMKQISSAALDLSTTATTFTLNSEKVSAE